MVSCFKFQHVNHDSRLVSKSSNAGAVSIWILLPSCVFSSCLALLPAGVSRYAGASRAVTPLVLSVSAGVEVSMWFAFQFWLLSFSATRARTDLFYLLDVFRFNCICGWRDAASAVACFNEKSCSSSGWVHYRYDTHGVTLVRVEPFTKVLSKSFILGPALMSMFLQLAHLAEAVSARRFCYSGLLRNNFPARGAKTVFRQTFTDKSSWQDPSYQEIRDYIWCDPLLAIWFRP